MKRVTWESSRLCRCALALFALWVGGVSTESARAALVTETYSGTFHFDFGSAGDQLGLDGATFLWQGTFDTAATPFFTNGSNLDRFQAITPITLTLSGTAGHDGIYTPAIQNTVGELNGGGGNDQYQFGNVGYFTIAGVNLHPGVMLVPPGFTGAVSPTNTFTPFNTANVISFTSWTSDNGSGGDFAGYSVVGPQISFVVVACVPPPPNMVGWWRGDGNADDSIGGNHGSLIGGATATAVGKVDQGFTFDGASDHVFISDSPLLNPTSQITVDAWVKTSSSGTFRGLVSKFNHGNGTPDDSYNLALEASGVVRWQVVTTANASGYILNSPSPIADGEWHHVAGTYDGATVRLFVDGISVADTTGTGAIVSTSTPLYLGAALINNSDTAFFDGQLDEVEIFDRALSAQEITDIFIAGSFGKCKCTPPPDSMISWWPGEGDGNDIQDGNNGTLNNITFAGGEVGQAFVFDGSTSDINVPASANLDVGASSGMTVDMWINPTAAGINSTSSGTLAEWNNNTNDAGIGTGLILNRDGGNNLSAGALQVNFIDLLGNGVSFGTGPGVIVADRWQHVAFTYDKASGIAALYVDGIAVLGPSPIGTFTPRTTYPLDFGIRRAGVFGPGRYIGAMDEMELFNRALTQSEIQAIYHAGSAGKCRPCTPPPGNMTHWWPGDGYAFDIQGANDGTLQDDATFASGKVGQAFSLDGVDDYVDVGDVDLPVTFTVDAWINPQDLSNSPKILDRADNSSISYEFYLTSSGALRLIVGNSNGDFTSYTSDAAVTTGSWQHVAATYDGNAGAGSKIQFFVNGVPRTSSLVASFDNGGAPADIPLTAKIGIFGAANANAFHGLIDELETFDRVLSAAEIQSVYDAGSGGKCKPAIPAARHLVNISTRASVGTGDDVAIGGFILRDDPVGPRPNGGLKSVLIRALGPSLNVNGTPVPGRLADTVLELHDNSNGGALVELNDDWGDAANAGDVTATGLAPTDSLESAILITLFSDSAYTAILRGKNDTTGIGLVEVYDLEPNGASHLANISTRGQVLTGDDVLIGGIIVQGGTPARVMVRGLGPSLTAFSVANALADPILELHDGNGTLIATNDDWTSSPDLSAITATGLGPTNTKESAILFVPAPGAYTAIVSGVGGTTGVGMVEAYRLGPP